ncbi:MAG: nucleotidyltransferase family protein [Acidobacteria bacterium]|nr:nucleotidyltransferase family protein [Acidobacteriota bacterium]
MSPKLPIPRDQVAVFCQRNGIRRLSLFGSVLRDDFGPSSDVDVLVEFAPGVRFGYLGLMAMQEELGDVVGRPVEIYAPTWLRPWMREEVETTAELVYESAE